MSAGSPTGKRRFINVTGFPFPLSPLLARKTVRKEAVAGTVWMFEQEQGLAGFAVSTNVRMTVIRLSNNKLWVHAPVAPTEECCELLRELDYPVGYIVNPTYAYEHRVFASPFSRKFPEAEVYSVRNWTWPIPLPDIFVGLNVKTYLDEEENVEWANEIDFRVLPQTSLGIAPYTEAAFFHKSTKTLLVTDLLIYVPQLPPEVIPKDKLLDIGQPSNWLASLVPGGYRSPPKDVPKERLGWIRMSVLATFLGPKSLLNPINSFESLGGRLTVSPVLRILVFGKIRGAIKAWTDRILEWDFERIIPAHFDAPVRAGPNDVRQALACVVEREDDGVKEEDTRILRALNGLLRALRVVKEEE